MLPLFLGGDESRQGKNPTASDGYCVSLWNGCPGGRREAGLRMEFERVFHTLQLTQSLRPVYRAKDEWILSDVLLCWLALLMVRIVELKTDMTCPGYTA